MCHNLAFCSSWPDLLLLQALLDAQVKAYAAQQCRDYAIDMLNAHR